ncbi:hypothetical protein Plhal304r1_c090g0171201 [Plasmopara halstedii]
MLTHRIAVYRKKYCDELLTKAVTLVNEVNQGDDDDVSGQKKILSIYIQGGCT